MIIFEKVKVQNFLSVGNVPVEIDLKKCKITTVTGENGSAKSALFIDAPFYALYNTAYRNVTLAQLINSYNKKGMLVELEFSINQNHYKVRRGRKPEIFEIYMNGVLVPQMANVKDYQNYLEEHILKLDSKTFRQIVITGSTSYIPFMNLTAPERRVVIEQLFDLGIFAEMSVNAKSNLSELKAKEKEIQNSINIIQTQIQMQKKSDLEKIEQWEQDIVNYQEELKKHEFKVFSYEEEKTKLVNSFSIDDNKEEFNKLNEEYNKYTDVEKQLQEKLYEQKPIIDSCNKYIKFYSTNKTCPTCKSIISETFSKQQIDEHTKSLNEAQTQIDKLNDGLSKIKVIINRIKDNKDEVISKVNNFKSQVTNIDVSIKAEKNNIDYINQNIKQKMIQIDTAKNTESSDVQKFVDELEKKNKELESVHIDIKSVEFIVSMLKDDGVKAIISERYMPFINSFIASYLEIIGFNIGFTIDKNFKETISSKHKENFTYANLSEGEKKRVDLAIMFAFREFAKYQSSTSTNLLVLDEYDGGVLDADGEMAILSILQANSDSNVFIISHSTDSFANISDRTLVARKENGFSTLTEL